ncbi:unnamed protein product [Meganyctiphanes norvegica]|uniref:Tenascin-like protein n=1 Tax=Meganyctiphanes norvegica TaxID=48144 RepID=A0AAV2PQX7_MEGNR
MLSTIKSLLKSIHSMKGGLLDQDRCDGGGGGGRDSMSRLNGRVTHPGSAHTTANAHYQGVPPQYPGQQVQHGSLPYPQHNQHIHHDEFEPSCLVRTPSGNVYIPSDVPKTSTLEYKPGLHSPSLHSPVKGDHKAMEGYGVQFGSGIPVPVLPVRNNVRRSGGGIRGGGGGGPGGGRGVPPLATKPPRCSWRCTAIVFISITVVLAACLIYVAATSMLTWPVYGGCMVHMEDPIVVPDDQQLQHHANSRGNIGFFIVEEESLEVPIGPSPLDLLDMSSSSHHRMRRSVVQHDRPINIGVPDPSDLHDDPSMNTHNVPNTENTHNIPNNPISSHDPVLEISHSTLLGTESSSVPSEITPDSYIMKEIASFPSSLPIHEPNKPTSSDINASSNQLPDSTILSKFDKIKFMGKEANDKNNSKTNIDLSSNGAFKETSKTNVLSHSNNMDDSMVIAADVYAPVIDIVEYVNDDIGNLEEVETLEIEEELPNNEITIVDDEDYSEEVIDDGDISRSNDLLEKPVVVHGKSLERSSDYAYDNAPDDAIIEYVDDNVVPVDLNDESSNFEMIPQSLLGESQNNFINDNDNSDLTEDGLLDIADMVSEYTSEEDDYYIPPSDVMVGDDPSAYSMVGDTPSLYDRMLGDAPAGRSNRRPRKLGAFMAIFPTMDSFYPETGLQSIKHNEEGSKVTTKMPKLTKTTSSPTTIESSSTVSTINIQKTKINQEEFFSHAIGPYGRLQALLGSPHNEKSVNDNEGSGDEGPMQGDDPNRIGYISDQRAFFLAQARRSYDPRNPAGGPIPNSNPSHFPSRMLETLGVPKVPATKSPEYYDEQDNGGSNLAIDIFPHIFEYDLKKDHDDYYYDQNSNYYYNDLIEEEEDTVDDHDNRAVIQPYNYNHPVDNHDNRAVIQQYNYNHPVNDHNNRAFEQNYNYNNPVTRSEHREVIADIQDEPGRIISFEDIQPVRHNVVQVSQLPAGMKVMALTKEEFVISAPDAPRIQSLSSDTSNAYNYAVHEEVEFVPLERNPSFSTTSTQSTTTPTTTTTTTTPTTTSTTEAQTTSTLKLTTSTHKPFTTTSAYNGITHKKPKFATQNSPIQSVYSIISPLFAYSNNSPIQTVYGHGTSAQAAHSPQHETVDMERKKDSIPKFLRPSNGLAYAESPEMLMVREAPLQIRTLDSQQQYSVENDGRHESDAYREPLLIEEYHGSRHGREMPLTNPSDIAAEDDLLYEQTERIERVDSNIKTHISDDSVKIYGQHSVGNEEPKTISHEMEIPESHKNRRVTVNVSISTDELFGPSASGKGDKKNLYVLSVSVPTSGDGEGTNINIFKPDSKKALTSMSLKRDDDRSNTEESLGEVAPAYYIHTRDEGMLNDHPTVTPEKCKPCECDCQNNVNTNSVPIPHNYIPNANTRYQTDNLDRREGIIDRIYPKPPDPDHNNPLSFISLNSDKKADSNSQPTQRTPAGCIIVQAAPTSTTSTVSPTTPWTIPPLPADTQLALEEHAHRPYKTIPPDGTSFHPMNLSQQLRQEILPYGYWNMQFYQKESAYVKFDISIPRGSSIGIYGRRNALPTHTSYDFLKVLNGYKTSGGRITRSSMAPLQPQKLTRYLEQGHWFLSLYNDDGDPREVTIYGEISTDDTLGCPKGCSGNGECILGACQCNPGFTGPDCTQMKCPVLCSNNGEYRDGECVCRPGWKGRECAIRHDECEVPDCNGHGHCQDGKCRCAKGFKGEFCEEVDCPHPTCSGHGWCVSGSCVCQKGWRGAACDAMDDAALQCLPDCSGHGHFDLESHQCVCDPEWTGSECSKRVCDLDCGPHGRCEGGACLCDDAWTGTKCDLIKCDPRCEEHGQCKNGTCICMTGWNGRHCTLAGCPGSCSGHGSCIMEEEEWTCKCHDGWEAHDCSVLREMSCSDGIDNDNDGLVDCADAECCSTSDCQQSSLCLTSVEPIDILLRKQPPAVTASFFQRMRFIVEEGSVQIYAKGAAFNESRASVVRGRVISGRGTGLVGVRVSHYRPADTGFTLTRHDGWFDLMVNGGGAVRLLFGKSPFLPVTETVWVPWNEVVVIDTVVMTTHEVVPPPPPSTCPDHNYDALKPVVLATWKHGFQGGCPDQSAILTESQVVQESLAIPGSGLHLVYHSSRAPGYESTIQLQLTPSEIPEMLRRIYLRITIEGILFEKTFEADPDIKFTYAWNRLNVYRQRVYGVTWALVKVGYAYANCDQIIWDSQTTQVSGHDMSISDIGGWDLSIHHRYNFHEGILQKGDGRNVHIKQKPRVMRTLMGDGHQREVNCRSCDGSAEHQRLLTPAALAPGPDGSLFIADFNLIRRVMPDDTVRTVVQLNETRVSYRYHLAVSPVTGEVYISDHEEHLILKVRDPDDFSRPEENYMPYVGSGERCLPGDEVGCGDGSLARDAKLQYPKGMAVSINDILYFADGTNVRAVDADGIITTVIGTHRHRSHWKPLPCEGTVPVSDVSLRWPTALAVSPLDDSLYVLDDHHVLRLTRDGQIKVVAGRPLHCPPLAHDARTDMAQHTTLRSPQSLAFAPNGDLYIAESDNERINRVRIIGTDERIHDFAGADSKCNCQEETCQCFDDSHVLAATAIFSTISALAVSPDGVVHVLDQGNLRLRSVTSSLPQPTSSNRLYEIYFPETQEMYIFDRFGHHIETRNIPTGRTIYKFAYNVNTSNGKLASVTDAAGNRVSFLRDYTGQVSMIENSRQQKCRLRVSRMRKLEEIITPDEHNVSLTYHGATGLLRSRMDSTGRAYVYTYDKYGRLIRAVTPSGQVVDLTFDLSVEGAIVTITHDGTASKSMLIKGALVTETIGMAPSVTAQLADGSVVTRTGWGHHIATDTVPYSLLKDHTIASSFPVAGRQRTEIGDELVNSFDWKYFNERPDRLADVTQVGRKMRVNGEDLLTFKYDIKTGTEAVLNKVGSTLLNVTYDVLGRPLRWSPGQPFLPVQLTYKRFGQLEQWSWGDMTETFTYDRAGRFEGIEYADGGKVTYFFKDMSSVKPYKVSVLSGAEHLLEHDEGGALSAITTPRGNKYVFHVQPSLLHNRFTFTPPGYPRHPYQLFYTDDGKVLAEVYPHEACRLVYHYDTDGRLQSMLFGEGSVEYGYQPETGLVRSVAVRDKAFELRIDNKYHAGLVKEQKVRFGTSSGLAPAKLRFLYDGNARPRRVELEINGKEQPDYDMKYDMILGTLESIQDLKVTTSYHNKTVVQDIRKTMLRVNSYDPHGRIIESSLTLRGRLTLRLHYSYDVRGRIATIVSWRGPRSEEHQSNYTYSSDGFLQGVDGLESWQFRYDANGNMISVVEGGREMTATYDTADRLIGWGDVELNTYSAAGGVVRQGEIHFSYSARGNIRSAWMRGHYRVWYRHDHKGRLTVWEDDRGNVTQYFYADLKRPTLPTHIHYPKRGVTHALFYDERGHLLALDTESGRYWVATDHYGTPMAVFDDSGVMVKEMVRSPWGALIKDTRPDFYIHIDFQGGLRDPATGLLIFGLHSYDPVHAMWMSPRYDLVTKAVDDVAAVYVHRFRNNDPVTPPKAKNPHYTDLDSWLKLYGVDLSLMLGSQYHDETVELPKGLLKAPQLAPSLNVISGLSCSTGGVLKHFSEPSLMPQSLVQSSSPAWTMPTWSVLGHFSSSPPVLGPGVVVSRVQDRALVTLVPSRENSVVQDVARDVLNGSALLDVTMTHHHHHTLYLVKEDPASRHDDLQNLQRLSGLFNVTSKEDGEHPEVRVVGIDVSLIIQYGTDSVSARKHLLRHAHHRAVERAWEMERRLAERGAPTTHPWSVEEREELISSGKVSGFLAADLHNIHRYPLLADDPTNVVFRRDTARRRRRSRRASHS